MSTWKIYLKERLQTIEKANGRDYYTGMTLLMRASRDDHPGLVQLFLKDGAMIDDQKNDGWTALMLAAYNENVDIVRILLNNRANVFLRDDQGCTALQKDQHHILQCYQSTIKK